MATEFLCILATRGDAETESPVYVQDSPAGRVIADKYAWDRLSEFGVISVKVAKTGSRIPQGAVRLDALNRSGGKSYR